MSFASRAADLYYSYRFIKILTRPWEEMEAYKLGIIDDQGERVKGKRISSSDEKAAYTTFHRLVFNVKRLLGKIPGGRSTLASYAAALYLLKEHYDISEDEIQVIVEKTGFETLDFMCEDNKWFIIDGDKLSPGIYRLKEEKIDNVLCEQIARKNDKVRVVETQAVGEMFGLNIYKALHMNTGRTIYLTAGEIIR